VEARGKHLLIKFDGGQMLHSHMRMTGSWHVYAPGEKWLKAERHAKAVLTFDDVVAVCFNAPIVDIVADETRIAHLGPDILERPFDVCAVIARARRGPDATIAELLLNQRVCAGIGNIYRCDTLWEVHMDPWTAPDAIDDSTLARCYETARALMRSASLSRRHTPRVHGRGNRPCRRCGTPIAVRAVGPQARMLFWCGHCQVAPGRTGSG